MKKAIALLATLVVLTSTAFAQLAPSISGSAETFWGVNLDDETNGFETDTSVTVTIPLSSGSVMTEGEGATGYADITGTSVTLDLNLTTDGTDFDGNDDDDTVNSWDIDDDDEGFFAGQATLGDISAKIDFANGLYAQIGGHSDVAANLVEGDRDFLDVNPQFNEEEGISFGYAVDTYSVEFTIANETEDGGFNQIGQDDAAGEVLTTLTSIIKEDAEQTGDSDETTIAANDDGYVMGATAMYTAGDIFTLDLAFGTDATKKDADTVQTGIAAKITSVVTEGVTLTVPVDYLTIAYDDDTTDFTMTAMELLPSIDLVMGAATAGVSFHYINLNMDTDGFEAYTGTVLAVSGGYTLDAGTAGITLGSSLAETAFSMDDADTYSWDNDAETDMDLTVELTWTADVYNVTLDLGDVLLEDGLNEVGFDAGFTGVEGVTVALETTLVNGDVAFALDNLNVDFDSAITGLENTVLTVNYSGFATDDTETDGDQDTKGIFYFGATISL